MDPEVLHPNIMFANIMMQLRVRTSGWSSTDVPSKTPSWVPGLVMHPPIGRVHYRLPAATYYLPMLYMLLQHAGRPMIKR